jgi:hypothetical protein
MTARGARELARRVALACLVGLAIGLVAAPGAGAFVYWANNSVSGSPANSIGRANLDGTGANQSFITGASNPAGVAVDGAHVYWANFGSGAGNTIGRANLDGTGANQSFITTAAGITNPCMVAVNGTHVFWANNNGFVNTIGRANLDGTGVDNSFITGANQPCGVAVNATHIYWANYVSNTGTTIGRANLDGTGVDQSFITGASGPIGVAVDDTHIYWVNLAIGAIGRANLDGTGVDQSFITGGTAPAGVAVDDTHIYWANQGGTTIGRANLDGTGVNQSFITGAASPYGVAVDDLGPSPQIDINDVSVGEGDSGTTPCTLFVALNVPAPAGGVTVDFATADGTATVADNDYVADSGQVSFAEGDQFEPIAVDVVGDTAVEGAEEFSVNLSNPSGATIGDADGTCQITDDDSPPPAITIDDVPEFEGNAGTTPLAFTVALDQPAPAGGVTVDFATADGTATVADNDYVAESGQVSFAEGEDEKQIVVDVVGDTTVEPDEAFFVDLSNASGATIADDQGLGGIFDDEAALTVDDVSASEGDSGQTGFSFTLSLDRPAGGAGATVNFATADGTATFADNDYLADFGQVSFAAGEQQKEVVVQVIGDTKVEPGETFTLNLSGARGATIADGQGTGTIQNDDALTAQPSISIGDVAEYEGNSGATSLAFLVTLSRPAPAGGVGVSFATAEGQARVPRDFTRRSGRLVFSEGEQAKRVVVIASGDRDEERDEELHLDLSNSSGATIADGRGTGTIRDDDRRPEISIEDRVIRPEGDSGNTAFPFVVVLDHPAPRDGIRVAFATDHRFGDAATAAERSDYEPRSGVLTFNEGQQRKTVRVRVNGDRERENDERFRLSVSDASKAEIADAVEPGIIENDDVTDDAGLPFAQIGNGGGAEGDSGDTSFSVTVTLSAAAPAGGAVIDYRTLGSAVRVGGVHGATPDEDFVSQEGKVTLPEGESTAAIVIPVHGDTEEERDEVFSVDLVSASGARLEADKAAGRVEIVDDDFQPIPKVRISDFEAAEGDAGETPFEFRVRLSHPALPGGVSVQYETVAGTAKAGKDFVSQQNRLTIPEGETRATITVPVLGDTKSEPKEIFAVTIARVEGAVLPREKDADNAAGEIRNDD